MFKKNPNSGGSLLADLADLFRLWWRKDRVRTSPSEGRLLGLAAGSIVDIQGLRVVVNGRHFVDTPQGAVVRYTCEGPAAACELWISLRPVPAILLVTGGEERELDSEDIEVWPPRQPPGGPAA